MKTTTAPVPRFAARLAPAATAMVWWERGRPHEPMAVLDALLAPGDALVAIELAIVCEGDVEIARGRRPVPVPLVLGHEGVGRVVTAGAEAVDDEGAPLRPGERVVWSVATSCGQCAACRAGVRAQCTSVRMYGHERVQPGWELSGAFATHLQLLAGTDVVKVDAAVPAALIAPLSCRLARGTPPLADDPGVGDLRTAVRRLERAWRRLPPPEVTILPLSRVDEALALAERGRHGCVGVDPRIAHRS